jgi:uncharacterized protein YdaU (DUF1376 family)
MPLYVADYLADTMHLSAAEHGAYLLLLMHCWQKGPPPDDDAQLARIARMTRQEWRRARPTIEAFFEPGWLHRRVAKEQQKRIVLSEKRSAVGRLGVMAKARKSLETNDQGSAIASDLLEQTPSKHPSKREAIIITTIKKDKKLASLANAREALTGFDEWWDAYPNKVGKADAVGKYRKAVAKVGPDVLLDGLRRYVADKPADRQWCNPSTWLHQERWNDEPATPTNGHANGKDRSIAAAADRLVDYYANGGRDPFDTRQRDGADEGLPLLLPTARSS